MYHVVAATTNPAKIKAISLAFDDVFGPDQYRIEGIEVDSGVPEQPIGNHETRTGSRHRVMCAVKFARKLIFGSVLKRVLKRI